jgi:predicted thioesterase
MKEVPADLQEELTIATTPEMGTTHLGPGRSFYSTPSLVGHIEALCLRMLSRYLDEGENSVGYRVEVKHLAPTPIGQRVTIRGRLVEADGRRFVFAVEAYNEGGVKIAEGLHERRVIDVSRFVERAASPR